MSALDRVLERLTDVKRIGERKWMAKSPLHDQKTGSVSIRETDDGRVLIYDFGGDSVGDILRAIGLTLGDLFDKPLAHHLPPVRGGFTARELLEINAHEATVVALLAADAQSRPLTQEEGSRLLQAASRLSQAQGLINGR